MTSGQDHKRQCLASLQKPSGCVSNLIILRPPCCEEAHTTQGQGWLEEGLSLCEEIP